MAAEAPVLVGFTTTLTSDCRPDYLHNYLHNRCQSCAGEKHRVLVINDRKGSWGEVRGFLEEATVELRPGGWEGGDRAKGEKSEWTRAPCVAGTGEPQLERQGRAVTGEHGLAVTPASATLPFQPSLPGLHASRSGLLRPLWRSCQKDP